MSAASRTLLKCGCFLWPPNHVGCRCSLPGWKVALTEDGVCEMSARREGGKGGIMQMDPTLSWVKWAVERWYMNALEAQGGSQRVDARD